MEAATDLMDGLSQSKVARKFGVSRTTASRWHRAIHEEGAESLRKRRATGRPCRLSPDQVAKIPEIYLQGAAAHGYPDNRWTTARMASVIEQNFNVHYDQDHVGRLLNKMGLRVSTRRRRALRGFAAPAAAYSYPVPPELHGAV